MNILLVFVTTISIKLIFINALSIQREVSYSSTNLSPFVKYVYQLIYPDIFEKMFDSNLTPQQAAVGWYASPMFFSKSLGLKDAGTLPLEISQAAEQAFASGRMTNMAYFTVLANTAEGQLSKVINPSNTMSWANIYSNLLGKALQGQEYITHEYSIYAITVAHIKLEKMIGDYTLDDIKNGMRKIRDEFIKAASSKI